MDSMLVKILVIALASTCMFATMQAPACAQSATQETTADPIKVVDEQTKNEDATPGGGEDDAALVTRRLVTRRLVMTTKAKRQLPASLTAIRS